MASADEFRKLPKIDRLIDAPALAATVARHGREATLSALRAAVEHAREQIGRGQPCPSEDAIATDAVSRADADARPTLRRVINATGVVIHTNLGRAPLSNDTV